MSKSPFRWSMTAIGEPMLRSEFEPIQPGAGEVLVEIAGCGVCHTDLGYYYDGVRFNHALPLTLGHEISGRVVAAIGLSGPASRIKPARVKPLAAIVMEAASRISSTLTTGASTDG